MFIANFALKRDKMSWRKWQRECYKGEDYQEAPAGPGEWQGWEGGGLGGEPPSISRAPDHQYIGMEKWEKYLEKSLTMDSAHRNDGGVEAVDLEGCV